MTTETTGPTDGAETTARPARGSVTRGFLFSDLRGYTDYVERAGNSAAAALLARYFALVRAAIERFSGAEVRTEGDSFYVVFIDPVDASLARARSARGRIGRALGPAPMPSLGRAATKSAKTRGRARAGDHWDDATAGSRRAVR